MKSQKYFNYFPAKEFNCAAEKVLFKKGVSPMGGADRKHTLFRAWPLQSMHEKSEIELDVQ